MKVTKKQNVVDGLTNSTSEQEIEIDLINQWVYLAVNGELQGMSLNNFSEYCKMITAAIEEANTLLRNNIPGNLNKN